MARITIFLLLVVFTAIQGRTVKRVPIIRDNRIVNGQNAQAGEFPSQLSLQRYNSHSCGASILNANWALTAAHCVDGASASSLSLVAGTILLNSGGSRHSVAQIVIHANYDENDSWRNDIAVLRVQTPFAIGGNIQPVRLPSAGQTPAEGSTATVIGWGRLTEGGSLPNNLQKVDIAIVRQSQCSSIYGFMGYAIYSSQICGGDAGNKGSCNGDSGGPLFVDGTVVGLVSWANGCARPSYPTVYTRVSEFRSWITQQTGV